MLNILFNPVSLAISTSTGGFLWPLYWLFGKAMGILLNLLGNEYFVAIIIFTIVTRLLLLPLNIRQQKTMAKTTRMQPKIQKIQKKYQYTGTNPAERQKMQQKMNEEMQALYSREGHNPMQMGCGPMIFQMVFLMGIVGIIYYPLSYVIGLDNVSNEGILKTITELGYEGRYMQLGILENWSSYKDTLISAHSDIFNEQAVTAIEQFRSGLYIGKLDMAKIPHWKDGLIVIIPIVSFLTSLLSSVVSMLISKKNNPAQAQQANQMMLMMLMMPVFSLYISFQVPAAVGFYWIISNVIAVFQQLFIFKQFPTRKTQAHNMIENTIMRRSREENIKKTK